jgi:heme exporter protein D
MSEFLAMGGYALYVWGSWGISVGVLILMAALPLMSQRKLINKIAKQAHREALLKENQTHDA